jgi:hypothetical protein
MKTAKWAGSHLRRVPNSGGTFSIFLFFPVHQHWPNSINNHQSSIFINIHQDPQHHTNLPKLLTNIQHPVA